MHCVSFPPNANPCLSVRWDGPSLRSKRHLGQCSWEDASSLSNSKGFPTSLMWQWHEEWSQILVLAFFPIHCLRPLFWLCPVFYTKKHQLSLSAPDRRQAQQLQGPGNLWSFIKKIFNTTWGPFCF